MTQYGTIYLEMLVKKEWDLGALSADGALIWDVTVPGNTHIGKEYPMQAMLGPMGNPNSVATNLMLVKVRDWSY